MDSEKQLPAKILKEIKEIPTIPDVVVKVMQLTRDPEASAKQLTMAISNDPGLTGNLLRLCNSAYYGIPRVVSSLNQAVMYLGFHTVRNLVLTCSVSRFFNPEKQIYGYVKGGLWHHSVASAIACEQLCKKIRSGLQDTAYTAGLLHDIGQLIMGTAIKDTADTIIDLMKNGGMSELDAEQEAVGFSHAELGAELADQWNFPDELIHAIRYHHEPEQAPGESLLPAIVHVANSIVLDLGYGVELEEMKHPAKTEAMQAIGVTPEMRDELKGRIEELVNQNAPNFLAMTE